MLTVQNIRKSPPILIIFQSIILAFYADMKPVAWTLGYGGFGFVGDSVMGVLYPTTILIILILAIPKFSNYIKGLTLWKVILPLFLILFYYITNSIIGPPRVSWLYFLVFTVSSFLIPQFATVDVQLLMKSMMIIPSFAILHLDQVFFSTVLWADILSMDASYAFIIPITATFCYLHLYFFEENKSQKIVTLTFSFVNIVFLWQILYSGSRGPVVSLIFLNIFLLLVKISKRGGVIVYWRKLVAVSLMVIIISYTFESLLFFINGILLENGFNIRFIQKFYDLALEGNISHGRDDIAAITTRGFWRSPLWGNGVDRFEANVGGEIPYPHNFILQILYDGGLILFCMLIPIVKGVRNKYKNCTKDQYAVMTLFLFASVPGALFSQDLWNIAILWMFFGIAVSKNFVHEINNQITFV